jgi:V/A-type H+-transporting ATPase subunit K
MGIIAGILTLVAGVIYFFILFRAIASRKKESVKRAVILGTLVLVLSFVVLGLFSTNVFAQETSSAEQQTQKDNPIALGLKYVGAALAVGLAAIGAGIAVGPIGVSAISVIAEKPEMLGTSLIFIGLAEGIAIYGIAIAILIMFVI